MASALDHVVINVLRRMDEAEALFAALGFTLTPRGRHSLGSVNHLMMADGAYLELVGVPAEGRQRQDVLDSPFGLNGLVLKTDDADETHARLARTGLAPAEPVAFSRPVTIDGVETEARFRTVRLAPGRFPAGRVYFCQHLTPELVWRPEWLGHPNRFLGLSRVEVTSAAPATDAAAYAVAANATAEQTCGDLRVTLPDFVIDVVPGDRARFATLELVFDGLDAIGERARATPGAEWSETRTGSGAKLALPAFDLVLACRSAR
ncbi:VOC family protein [Methylopila musalis]|uniref:VOC family protein n=1 Tax=Methylopila musalis TaxID=1134781 RepID=A0ABW3Z7P8_9HYPH